MFFKIVAYERVLGIASRGCVGARFFEISFFLRVLIESRF